MIKSINQLVTQECDSRCKTCNMWAYGKIPDEMSPQEFKTLYDREEFRNVEDLCISGGEPTLRNDLNEIMDNIRDSTPNLRMLFLATNANHPKRVLDFVEHESKRTPELYVCISLEGNRETHYKQRGVDSYEKVVKTLSQVGNYSHNVKPLISTTITPINCNIESLEHVAEIASKTNATYSFRPASLSENFYKNARKKDILLSKDQMRFLMSYIDEKGLNDPYLDELRTSIAGERTIMGNRDTSIDCLAGKISIFIKPDGIIYPCINSKHQIGNKFEGITEPNYAVGDCEPCPCCTECQVWPMINFKGYGEK